MTYTLCPECRKCLGDISKFVELARKGLIKSMMESEFKNHTPDKIELSTTNIDIGFILDTVGAKLICCRQHLLGAKEENLPTYV
jgi:hypothetical protein